MSKKNNLNLPQHCILKIIKYIVLNCEINGENIREVSVKYIDLVNFVVVDRFFEETFKNYHKKLYKELEFIIVANGWELSIKFYELYERIKHFSEREQDVFWRTYSNSIKQNHRVSSVGLVYDPKTYWSGYLDAYELCKEALRNKKSVDELLIQIKGYCIDDLAFLENIIKLHLEARTTAEVLVNFCKANPNLLELKLDTSDIYGRLSDITNFCPNLLNLSFHMKAGVDEAEYKPLKKMPKLRYINLVSCEDTSPLKILAEMNYSKRSEIKLMDLTIRDSSEDLVRAFKVALCDSLQYFKYESEFKGEQFRTITEAKYDICETFQEKSALEASICLDGINFIEFRRQDRILTLRLNVLDIRKLGFISQLPDFERLEIEAEYQDTIPFENIKELQLRSTTINVKALVEFCVSNPDLNELNFINKKWIGNLSDIAPHCPNLQILKFELLSGASIADFTPLVLQAKLRHLFIKVSIEEKNTLTSIYNEMKVWNSPRNQPFLVHLHATFLASNKCTLGRLDILKNFRCSCNGKYQILEAEYDYGNEGRNPSLSEDLEVSISMGGKDEIVFDESRRSLYLALHSEFLEYSDICKMFPKINFIATNCNPDFLSECILNFTNLSYLIIESEEEKEEDSFVNLFRNLSTTKLINLNALLIRDYKDLDQFEVAELAKIKSLRLLACSLLEQDYVEHLSKLTNLQFINIDINSRLISFEKGLWDWLDACENIIIIKYNNVEISIYKYKRMLKIESFYNFNASDLIRLSALRDIEIVEISGEFLSGSLNKLFEAFSLNSACTVIELDISELEIEEDISNITQIQSIKKLKCSLLKIDGIEKLAQLPNIEDLTIETEDPASLVSFFEDLAAKKNPAIRYLEINEKNLRPEEVVKICQLPFLSRLKCSFHNSVDGQYFANLANSNIEELSVEDEIYPNNFYKNLFASFSQNTTLKHLTTCTIPLEIEEISEISKMKGLKIFETGVLEFKDVEFLWRNSSIEHLVINELDITSSYLKSPGDTGFNSPVSLKKMVLQSPISFRECQHLIMLESLESLECQFEDTRNINILADLKNLKVLIIKEPEDENEDEEHIRLRESYWELYRDLALKKSSTLKELHAPINSTQELYEIKKIKSLNTLNISYSSNIECLVELTDLETLYISDVEKTENIIPIFRSCKKLSFVQLKFKLSWRPQPNFLGEVINILKIVRNPEIQKPLQLTILYDMGENIEMEGIDGSYLEAKLEFLPFDIWNLKNWPSK